VIWASCSSPYEHNIRQRANIPQKGPAFDLKRMVADRPWARCEQGTGCDRSESRHSSMTSELALVTRGYSATCAWPTPRFPDAKPIRFAPCPPWRPCGGRPSKRRALTVRVLLNRRITYWSMTRVLGHESISCVLVEPFTLRSQMAIPSVAPVFRLHQCVGVSAKGGAFSSYVR